MTCKQNGCQVPSGKLRCASEEEAEGGLEGGCFLSAAEASSSAAAAADYYGNYGCAYILQM